MPCGRYAPSPTGRLHFGNLRTAVLAWLQVRLSDGMFVLRIDDLDTPRNKAGSLEQILDDLRWLGIDWDEGPDIGGENYPYLQSQRNSTYKNAFVKLNASGKTYPCKCSRKDIANILSAPHPSGTVTAYPGTCRPNKSIASIDVGEGELQAWRFIVGNESIEYNDLICGNQVQELEHNVGDFVIRRRDGLFVYHLASIVDDYKMDVTDVVRGDDLIESTPRQIALMNSLGYPIPDFWHVPMVFDNDGERMSKRDGSDSLEQWKNTGKTAEQLIGQFASSLELIDKDEAISCNELLGFMDLNIFKSKLNTSRKKKT